MKSYKGKVVSCLMVSTTFLTSVGGALIINAPVAHAVESAKVISSNPVSDTTSDRTLTLWKYEINNTAELGERGDGETAPDLTGKKVMQDVTFEVVKVIPKVGVSLTDPTKQTLDKGDYTIDPSFTAKTGMTDKDGKLVFDLSEGMTDKKLADGIYLVREVATGVDANGKEEYTYTDPATGEKGLKVASPMAPFFAWVPQTSRKDTGKLIYDVNVYPKNIVTDVKLDKTIEGGKGFSIQAGNSFQWEATTKLPEGLYNKITKDMTITNRHDKDGNPLPDLPVTATPAAPYELYADYFSISDDLNTQLLLDDVVVEVTTDGSNWTSLTNGAEYKVSLNGTEVVAPNPVKNTTAGEAKKVVVDLTQAGMKKLTEDQHTHIRVIYKVSVEKDFNGTIDNEYKVGYLIPGQKPMETTSDKPEFYDGGFKLNKVAEDGTTKLAGAEFYLAESESDAKAKKFLASDGKVYTLKDDGTADPALPAGVEFLKSTSDATGKAEFNGLKLDWFTDSDNNGKQDPSIPSEATWDKTAISKDYWVVETKSPDGYELLKTPVKVTVTLDTDKTLVVDIENKAKTELPFTGGTGTTILVVLALGAITIGAVAISIDKKRRHA